MREQLKVSDYVAGKLSESGIKDLFLISGGGMMHLLDSVRRQEDLNLVFNLNEQASAICAESYAQYTNHLGACMVTTGPGATNAVTGCAGAWGDGTPVLFISGQCKTEQMGQLKGLRIYGSQEIAIIPMVKPITKYAEIVLTPESISYHLEKAIYLATHGRKGPVWIDIPLDIQGAKVRSEDLEHFDPILEGYEKKKEIKKDKIKKLFDMLNASKRPAILIGHGIVAAERQEEIRNIVEEFQIPVLSTWRAKGVFGDNESLFMGSPGAPATRFSNYILQNSDFLMIMGTRLNPAITAFDEANFAPDAQKVIVDIEEGEINKLNMEFALTFVNDVKDVVDGISSYKEFYEIKDRKEWLDYCTKIKNKYPLNKEKQPIDNEGKVDGFLFADKLSNCSKSSDVFIGSSSGRTCGISHMAYRLKQGQKFVTSMGLGSMGWCVPSAISCCIASGKRRTLVIEGDGSFQHNIQELKLITTYNLPLKIFVLSNEGYASIYTMQKNNFQSNFAGCNESSGLELVNIRRVSKAYELPYYCIENDLQIENILNECMKDDSPCICEIQGSIYFDEIPKSVTVANADGTFSSCKLENLYPFVSKKEQEENMPKWK